MKNINDLIPKDKFDTTHLEEINRLPDADFVQIADALLEWIQDINWPVAQKILPILIDRQSLMMNSITKALDSQDDVWKYWIIVCIVSKLESNNLSLIMPILKRIQANPTESERFEEVYLEVDNFLKQIKTSN